MVNTVTRITSNLYITDIDSARNGPTSSFDVVITICQDNIEDNVGCEYHHFPLSDGEPQGLNPGVFTYELFKEAVETTVEELEKSKDILLHCHAGANRSVAVGAVALAEVGDERLDNVLWKIKKARPLANPSRQLMDWGWRYLDEKE